MTESKTCIRCNKNIEEEDLHKIIIYVIQEKFTEMQDQFKTDCYKGFERKKLNNAVLMAYRRYFHRLDRFEALYERFGKDLKRVVEFFKEIKSSGYERALTSFKE